MGRPDEGTSVLHSAAHKTFGGLLDVQTIFSLYVVNFICNYKLIFSFFLSLIVSRVLAIRRQQNDSDTEKLFTCFLKIVLFACLINLFVNQQPAEVRLTQNF